MKQQEFKSRTCSPQHICNSRQQRLRAQATYECTMRSLDGSARAHVSRDGRRRFVTTTVTFGFMEAA